MSWPVVALVACVWLYDVGARWELRKRIERLEALIRHDRRERGLP